MDSRYSRLTNHSHEDLTRLLSNSSNTNDSPDLGPPPIAHFEEEDPIKFDPGQLQNEPGHGFDGVHEISATLSANLETRKKRRDSTSVSEFKRASRFEPRIGQAREPSFTVSQEAPEQPLRVSAKRKLDARDVDDQPGHARLAEGDDFTFQRNAATSTTSGEKHEQENLTPAESRVSTKVTQDLAAARGVKREKAKGANNVTAASGRKALGPSMCFPRA